MNQHRQAQGSQICGATLCGLQDCELSCASLGLLPALIGSWSQVFVEGIRKRRGDRRKLMTIKRINPSLSRGETPYALMATVAAIEKLTPRFKANIAAMPNTV